MHWVDKICSDYGISINELARRAGISPGALGNCKARGTNLEDVKYSTVVKIASVCRTTADKLLRRY